MQSFSAAARVSSARWTAAARCSFSVFSAQPAVPGSPLIPASPASSHTPSGRRYQSTANRTKRALNVAPHASFLKHGGGRDKAGVGSRSGSASDVATTLGTIEGSTATLLYNPPASAPSVYQTPFKFLPKSDPRRRNNLAAFFKNAPSSSASPSPASSSSSSSSSPLAPELAHRSYEPRPRYHLSEDDVAEIRRLRTLDPVEWSVHRLARKYNCSPIFVMLVVRSSAEHQQARRAEAEAARSRWGPIRAKARADRLKRREMLYNGEL